MEPSRPGPEPGQRPTAPRAAASRPPAVGPLPSSRVGGLGGGAKCGPVGVVSYPFIVQSVRRPRNPSRPGPEPA